VGTAIRWGGGAFLLWLALGALRSAWRGHDAAAAGPAPAGGGGFATGLAIMLLNPKAGFFWVSLTGVLLGPGIGPASGTLVVTVAVLISLLWHAALALAFSGATAARLYARARRGIEAALGTALAALGIKLLAAS
jgi:threonine/homoserine/homoserine lactone efflux protein